MLRIIYQKKAPMGLSHTYNKMASLCHQNKKIKIRLHNQYVKVFIITKQKGRKILSVGVSMLQLHWLLQLFLLSHEYPHREYHFHSTECQVKISNLWLSNSKKLHLSRCRGNSSTLPSSLPQGLLQVHKATRDLMLSARSP